MKSAVTQGVKKNYVDVPITDDQSITRNKFTESGMFYAMLFFAGIVFLFLRSTYTFSSEVIYAEDGVWLGQIYQKGFFYTLFHARGDYLVWGNLIMLKIADMLNWLLYGDNVANLPMFIAFTHYLFYSACAVLPVTVFKKQLMLPARLFLWGAVILFPLGYYDGTSFEVFGKILNTGYLFFFIAFCLLVWRMYNKAATKTWKLVLCDILLFISCSTNPACFVEVVAFFFIDVIEILRSGTFKLNRECLKKTLSQKYVLQWIILACLLLIPFIYNKDVSSAPLDISSITINQIFSFLSINWLYPFTFIFYKRLDVKSALVLLIIAAAVTLFWILKNKKNERFLLISSLSGMVFFSASAFVARPGLKNWFENFNTFPQRYTYVQSIFALLVFSCCLSCAFRSLAAKQFKVPVVPAATILIALAVAVEYIIGLPRILEFNHNWYKDYNFKSAVSKVYETMDITNGCGILIEPSNWSMWLPKGKILSTYYGLRSFTPVGNTVCLSGLTDANWENGVMRGNPVMLFACTEKNLRNLLYYDNGKLYTNDGKSVNILNVQVTGNQWIHVTVDDYDTCVSMVKSTLELNIGDVTE